MLRYQITIGVLCFVLGAVVLLAIQNYRKSGTNDKDTKDSVLNQEESRDTTLDSLFDDDFFRSNRSPFEEMEKMRERMMNQFGSSGDDLKGGLFDSWFKRRFGGGDPGDIQTREDEDFVYYDVIIKDLSNQKLDIRVEEGQIKISGTIEKKSENNNKNESSRQSFSSTFHRSFPVPHGVDDTKVQVEHDGDKIIIKLPKIK
ncbi:MAG: Hsp20 family protein [Candidatus Scalindua sp.]|nr:Hsp20 family protein [Candidatus Scalindua sp.]